MVPLHFYKYNGHKLQHNYTICVVSLRFNNLDLTYYASESPKKKIAANTMATMIRQGHKHLQTVQIHEQHELIHLQHSLQQNKQHDSLSSDMAQNDLYQLKNIK